MADLVLLEGDPLEDIRHTQKIAAVIVGGRLFDRRQLDEMLAEQALHLAMQVASAMLEVSAHELGWLGQKDNPGLPRFVPNLPKGQQVRLERIIDREVARLYAAARRRANGTKGTGRRGARSKRMAPVFLAVLAAPARRALEREGITTLSRLAACTEAQILDLHGVGPSSMPQLRRALAEEGMSFKGRAQRSP